MMDNLTYLIIQKQLKEMPKGPQNTMPYSTGGQKITRGPSTAWPAHRRALVMCKYVLKRWEKEKQTV